MKNSKRCGTLFSTVLLAGVTMLAAERHASAQGLPVMDDLLYLQLGYPVGGYLSTIVGLGLDLAPNASPSADDLLKQIPGTSAMISSAGGDIKDAQDTAIAADLADRQKGSGYALATRMRQVLDEIQGNAVDSISAGEKAELAYAGVSVGLKAAPDLATAVAIGNQLSLANLKRMGDIEKGLSNVAVAVTLTEEHRVEAQLEAWDDLDDLVGRLNN